MMWSFEINSLRSLLVTDPTSLGFCHSRGFWPEFPKSLILGSGARDRPSSEYTSRTSPLDVTPTFSLLEVFLRALTEHFC